MNVAKKRKISSTKQATMYMSFLLTSLNGCIPASRKNENFEIGPSRISFMKKRLRLKYRIGKFFLVIWIEIFSIFDIFYSSSNFALEKQNCHWYNCSFWNFCNNLNTFSWIIVNLTFMEQWESFTWKYWKKMIFILESIFSWNSRFHTDLYRCMNCC